MGTHIRLAITATLVVAFVTSLRADDQPRRYPPCGSDPGGPCTRCLEPLQFYYLGDGKCVRVDECGSCGQTSCPSCSSALSGSTGGWTAMGGGNWYSSGTEMGSGNQPGTSSQSSSSGRRRLSGGVGRGRAADTTRLVIYCPGDARIHINGEPMRGQGRERWFDLPYDRSRQWLRYDVQVSYDRDVKPKEQAISVAARQDGSIWVMSHPDSLEDAKPLLNREIRNMPDYPDGDFAYFVFREPEADEYQYSDPFFSSYVSLRDDDDDGDDDDDEGDDAHEHGAHNPYSIKLNTFRELEFQVENCGEDCETPTITRTKPERGDVTVIYTQCPDPLEEKSPRQTRLKLVITREGDESVVDVIREADYHPFDDSDNDMNPDPRKVALAASPFSELSDWLRRYVVDSDFDDEAEFDVTIQLELEGGGFVTVGSFELEVECKE